MFKMRVVEVSNEHFFPKHSFLKFISSDKYGQSGCFELLQRWIGLNYIMTNMAYWLKHFNRNSVISKFILIIFYHQLSLFLHAFYTLLIY